MAVIFALLFFTSIAQAGQVNLAWDPNTQSTLGGYKVYYGQASGNYSTNVDVAKQTSYTVANLQDGAKYYFAVKAYDTTRTVESGFSNEVSTTIGATAPPSSTALPGPWIDMDIGNVGLVGSASYANGAFTVKGSGDDIWNTADAFRFAYQPLSGDGSIVARVASITNTDSWAKAGVMIRESLDANARHAMVAVTAGNGVAFQRRTATGGSSTHTAGATVIAPYWVKLARSGNTFTAYQSVDGAGWAQIGSVTLSMATSVYVGLAVTSHNNSALNTSVLDNVSVQTASSSPSVVAPIANFSASPSSGSAPLTVGFSDQSSGSVDTWVWSFGDGGVSSTASPSHTYTNAGTYSVSLTVTGPGGSNTATKTNYITVKEAALTASFTASPSSGQAPLLVTFIASASTGGSIDSYDWTFSDNTTGSGPQVVKTFDAGNHTATLKVTGPGGSATATQNITATAAAVVPVANFSASPTSGTAPLTVQFTDTSTGTVTAWSWDFGDGTTPSTQQNPSHTYATTGTYTVKLTTTNSAGSNAKTQNGYITVSSNTGTGSSAGKFQQDSVAPNLVVMEAEHFNGNTAQSGYTWQATTSYGDYSGASALRALPEDNTRIDTNYAATSPQLDYQVNFVKTGTHYVWVRALGPSWSSDSLHVGLDGQEVASAARLSQLNPLGSWAWSKTTQDGTIATLNVTSPGVHIINVWMRESGTLLDKLMLTPDANYTPSGLGPDETLGQSTGKVPVSPTGLVAAYGFEEGSGVTVTDVSGQGNHGIIAGASWSTRGKFGNALYFNGADSWVTINDSASLDLTTGMTLEAWVYPTTSLNGWRCVLLKEQTNKLVYSLYASSDTNQPSTAIRVGNADQDQNLAGGPWLVSYQWVYLAATYDGTTQRLYVNGSEVANRRISGPIQTSNGVLRIGGNSIWGEYFNGRIDEVRIYNRALSASEIQSDMNTALQ